MKPISKGVTLIELMVAISILAILIAVAAPSMTDFLDRRRLISQLDGVSGLIQLARSEALRRSAGGSMGVVSVTIQPAASWYVGLSNDSSGCTDISNCTINESGTSVRRVWQNADCGSCTLISPVAREVVVFNLRGVVSNGANQAITIQSPQGKQLSIVVSAIGRIAACSPNGVTGYPSC
jgi:type IV fimbrial biogenesis protein FimT